MAIYTLVVLGKQENTSLSEQTYQDLLVDGATSDPMICNGCRRVRRIEFPEIEQSQSAPYVQGPSDTHNFYILSFQSRAEAEQWIGGHVAELRDKTVYTMGDENDESAA